MTSMRLLWHPTGFQFRFKELPGNFCFLLNFCFSFLAVEAAPSFPLSLPWELADAVVPEHGSLNQSSNGDRPENFPADTPRGNPCCLPTLSTMTHLYRYANTQPFLRNLSFAPKIDIGKIQRTLNSNWATQRDEADSLLSKVRRTFSRVAEIRTVGPFH